MKGLDGIQGPVYVGTGCVFRRQALYGYEPVFKGKASSKAACPSWCCGPRKKGKKNKSKFSKKKAPSRTDSSIPIFSLEDIEEGMEGTSTSSEQMHSTLFCNQLRDLFFSWFRIY